MMGLSASSWAFQSLGVSTITASAVTGGDRVADFSLVIRNVNDPFGANQPGLSWSNITPPSTQWKRSDQLIVINATVTDSGGGIKIYTDNTAGDAIPRFVDPSPSDSDDPDSLAAGLLKGETGTTSSTPLPMAWSIKAATGTLPTATEPNLNGLCSRPTDTNAFQWLYVTDKSNWDGIDTNNDGIYADCVDTKPLALDADFPKLFNRVGIHYGQSDTEFGAHPMGASAYIYFQANFSGAEVQQPYQTTTLRIEAFIE